MLKVKLINEKTPLKIKMVAKFPSVVLANLQDKETTPTKETQVVVADKTYDGLSKVTVNPIPNEYIIPSGEIEFTQNGTYNVTDKASAKVNIKEKVLGTKTITTNGTYNASDDNLDGYSEVEVATSGVDINEYLSDTITKGDSALGGWAKTIIKLRSPLTIEGTDAQYMFYNYPLNEIPQIDTSNVTNMFTMFGYCKNLTTIPQLNTSNVTDMDRLFYSCTNLTTIPQLDTSKVSTMNSIFGGCTNLTTIPQLDTSFVYDMSSAFYNCKNLTTIPQLNGERIGYINDTFNYCNSLENFNGIIDLGKNYYTTQSANSSYYKLNLSSSTKLTEQSIINILNNLYDIATKGVKPQQVTLGATNLAKLVSEEGQQALANSQLKGWNIS